MAFTWRLFILHQNATYGVNNGNHIIVGLPPPPERSDVTYPRSFGRSVMQCALRNLEMLVEYETATLRVGPCQELVHVNKYRQLCGFLRSLLSREEGLGLPPELEDLLDDADEHYPLDLRALRAFGMHQLQSSPVFLDESFVQPLVAGEYGYMPGGSMDIADFVLLGNIHDSEYRKEFTQVVGEAECKLFTSEHDPVIYHRSSPPMAAFSISDERECWLVPLPLNGSTPVVRVSYEVWLNPIKHAREFLVAHGASLALKHGVEAQDLILVSRSQREHFYDPDDWSRLPRTRHATDLDSTASDGLAFPVPVLPVEMLSEPSMLYLVTSSRPDFEAYVTDEPLSAFYQHPTNSSSSHMVCRRMGHCEIVDYVQLDKEDVVS